MSLADIAKGAPPEVLILVEQLVLGRDEIETLESFLDLGGTLIVDGRLAWIDRKGSPWSEPVLERLREHAPERVLVAPDGTENIAAHGRGGRRGHLQFLAERFPREEPTFRVVGPGADIEWLQATWYADRLSDRLEDQPTLVALLPSAPTTARRAELVDLRIEIESPYAIRWIHPPEGEPLPAGDAAVFLILGIGAADEGR